MLKSLNKPSGGKKWKYQSNHHVNVKYVHSSERVYQNEQMWVAAIIAFDKAAYFKDYKAGKTPSKKI